MKRASVDLPFLFTGILIYRYYSSKNERKYIDINIMVAIWESLYIKTFLKKVLDICNTIWYNTINNKPQRKVKPMATYNLFLDGTNRIHITGGNTKIGRGVFNISLLPSDEPLQKKDGKVLTNIKGTCGGCCAPTILIAIY